MSIEKYQQLEGAYGSDTLTYPCSRVSLAYSSLLDFQCRFHPVCTSDVLSNTYLQTLFDAYRQLDSRNATENAFTLEGTLFSQIQAHRVLCQLAKDVIEDARQQYLSSSIITASMIDSMLFGQQPDASLAQFQATLSDEFLSNLQLMRGVGQSNAFVSLYSTN